MSMTTVTIHKAKTQLSKLIEQVERGRGGRHRARQ
jgi:antitoxin (DNA-binding transcriptional repressor) of toxin-antitoxin stability system